MRQDEATAYTSQTWIWRLKKLARKSFLAKLDVKQGAGTKPTSAGRIHTTWQNGGKGIGFLASEHSPWGTHRDSVKMSVEAKVSKAGIQLGLDYH